MLHKPWVIAAISGAVMVGSVASVFAATTVTTKITVNGKTIEKTVTTDGTTKKTTTTTEKTTKTLNLACMQTAVDKRDGALVKAFDAYHTSILTALKNRQSALKTAWGISSTADRQLAIRKAWNEYRTERHTARKTFTTAKNNAWQTFMSERQTCKGSLIDDGTNAAVDIEI